MIIRSATLNDAEQLVVITQQAFIVNTTFDEDFKTEFMFPESAQDYFREEIEDPEWIFLVAEENNQLLGYITGFEKKIPYRRSRYLEIDTLAVTPASQGQGVGRQLVQAICDRAKARGFQKVYVNTYAKNQKAWNFYENNNFQVIDVCLEKTL